MLFSSVEFKKPVLCTAVFTACLSVLFTVSAVFLAQPAQAQSAFMSTGNITSQPIGHYEFCQTTPDECNISFNQTAPVKLNEALWEKVILINNSVNQRIEPVTDLELYGKEEHWAYPTTAGDCEDYVLLKRRELAQAGIPLSSMLITVVRKPDGEGHAVLTLRTDRGDFILDNLDDTVKNWQDTDYTYLKRQAANHTGRWVNIESPSNLVVGSVK